MYVTQIIYTITTAMTAAMTMGWLQSVGSIKLQVSFAEYCLFYRALLQKRPIIVSILLTKATPYCHRTSSRQGDLSVLQCVAVWCCVALCCRVLRCVALCCSALQCVAVCCSVLQCVAVCCSVLQCVAACCSAQLPSHIIETQRLGCMWQGSLARVVYCTFRRQSLL